MHNLQDLDDLAVFTGKPAFNQNLYVGRPNVGDREGFLDRVKDIFDRRWFTNNGRFVQEFEERLAALVGVKHCIPMCNATVALEIAIRALNLSGEVIVPAFTFIATAHSLQWQKITPVFCDIDPKTHNIDPSRIEELITPRTTGIIGVHVWGRPCEIEELDRIASRKGLKLLFDAAHAFCCSYKGKMLGRFGDAEVFSFHATKFFNTFEGGAVCTNNDTLAREIRLMKNFGFSGYDNVIHVGTNGKMTEVSAAMGLSSLERLDEFISVNRQNYEVYREELAAVPGVKMLFYDEAERNNYHYVVLEIGEVACGLSRDLLMRVLHAENVIARRYFYPGCHRMEPYKSIISAGNPPSLPNTSRLVSRVMSLPTGTSVSPDDIRKICQIIRIAVTNAEELAGRLV